MFPRRIVLPIVLLALGVAGCAQTFSAGAAIVNGVAIPTEVVERQIDAGAAQPGSPGLTGDARIARARDILISLIQGELIRQEGEARDIEITDEQIDQQIAQIRGEQSEEEFAQRVAQAGFTTETLREQVGIQIAATAIQRELAPEISEDDVREVYELSRQQFQQAKIKHILFRVPEGEDGAREERRTRSALVEIRAGASFERVARQRSEDPGSAKDGGRLPGWTPLQSLDPSFAQGVADAKIGEVTEPVRSQFGWHLILVEGRRTQPFIEVRSQLEAQLQQQGSDSAFQEFLQGLIADADVEVNPRYGDWDPESGSIIPHSSFTAPEPETDPLAPPSGFPFPGPQ